MSDPHNRSTRGFHTKVVVHDLDDFGDPHWRMKSKISLGVAFDFSFPQNLTCDLCFRDSAVWHRVTGTLQLRKHVDVDMNKMLWQFCPSGTGQERYKLKGQLFSNNLIPNALVKTPDFSAPGYAMLCPIFQTSVDSRKSPVTPFLLARSLDPCSKRFNDAKTCWSAPGMTQEASGRSCAILVRSCNP